MYYYFSVKSSLPEERQQAIKLSPYLLHQDIFSTVVDTITKSTKFKDILVVGKARIPVIKMVHSATNTEIDLVTKNGISYECCQIIQYYTELNEKILVFLLMLKQIFKEQKIILERLYLCMPSN